MPRSWSTSLLLFISSLPLCTQALAAPPVVTDTRGDLNSSDLAGDLTASKDGADAPHRDALAFLRQRIVSSGSTVTPGGLGRRSRRLLQQGGEVDPALLPARLPGLRPAADISVQRLVDRSRASARGIRGRYVWLERQAAILRGSNDLAQRSFSRRLRAYLARYKRRWAPRWLQRRMSAFRPSRADARVVVRFRPGVSQASREGLRARVRASWVIISSAVHPRLLQRLPTIRIEVSRRYPVAGIISGPDGGKIVTLLPESPVTDILHEVGHLIGAYGGLGVQAMAQAVRVRRGFGAPPQALFRLAAPTGNQHQVSGYPGSYADRYMGRYYSDGLTEVISVGIERFARPGQLLELMMEDGEQVLLLLKALQRAP